MGRLVCSSHCSRTLLQHHSLTRAALSPVWLPAPSPWRSWTWTCPALLGLALPSACVLAAEASISGPTLGQRGQRVLRSSALLAHCRPHRPGARCSLVPGGLHLLRLTLPALASSGVVLGAKPQAHRSRRQPPRGSSLQDLEPLLHLIVTLLFAKPVKGASERVGMSHPAGSRLILCNSLITVRARLPLVCLCVAVCLSSWRGAEAREIWWGAGGRLVAEQLGAAPDFIFVPVPPGWAALGVSSACSPPPAPGDGTSSALEEGVMGLCYHPHLSWGFSSAGISGQQRDEICCP